MNLQEAQVAFDKAYLGILANGFSRTPELTCRYRLSMEAQDNRRCAVGHLIPDEAYKPSMDQFGSLLADQLVGFRQVAANQLRVTALGFTEPDTHAEFYAITDFLRAMQRCHDDAYTLQEFKDRMQVLSKQFNLTIPEVPQ